MPNANTHDAITYALTPFTFLGAEMYWGDHLISILATGAMLFAGLMFGPDLDLNSRPYQRWGPLKLLWKPYQAALAHRSTLSHGPMLGTVIRVVYFLVVFSAFGATVMYFWNGYVHGEKVGWMDEFSLLREDMFSFWDQTERRYFYGVFAGLWLGALSHTTADVVWSTIKRWRPRPRRRR
ncbi:MAG: metal-binding protein [Blastocatellia bacterium]